jgi:hypothetical protein
MIESTPANEIVHVDFYMKALSKCYVDRLSRHDLSGVNKLQLDKSYQRMNSA